jgi:ASC-1-like (ASCH) protein
MTHRVHIMKFIEEDNCPIARYIVSNDVTVHGRKASKRNRGIEVGDKILFQVFNRSGQNISVLEVAVEDIKQYADVEEFAKAEGLDAILGDRTKCMNIKDESEYVSYYSGLVDESEILKLKKKHGYGFIGFHISFIREYNIFRKSVQEPWYTHIKKGQKTVEGRLNKSWVTSLNELDRVIWLKSGEESEHFSTYVEKLASYSTFEEMLRTEGLENVLPGVETIEDGIQIYREFYSEDDEKKYGVIGIHMKLL